MLIIHTQLLKDHVKLVLLLELYGLLIDADGARNIYALVVLIRVICVIDAQTVFNLLAKCYLNCFVNIMAQYNIEFWQDHGLMHILDKIDTNETDYASLDERVDSKPMKERGDYAVVLSHKGTYIGYALVRRYKEVIELNHFYINPLYRGNNHSNRFIAEIRRYFCRGEKNLVVHTPEQYCQFWIKKGFKFLDYRMNINRLYDMIQILKPPITTTTTITNNTPISVA